LVNLFSGRFVSLCMQKLCLLFCTLLFLSCNREIVAPYSSGSYSQKTLLGIEDTFLKNGYKKIGEKNLKTFEGIQQDVEKEAIFKKKKIERTFKWSFWVYPDSINSFLTYIPPSYAVFSSAMIRNWDSLSVDSYSAVVYHFFGHYEAGHFRKRSEFLLQAEFGGSSLKIAVEHDIQSLLEGFITFNGAIGNGRRIQPFKVQEEAEAEGFAKFAFVSKRIDSLSIQDAWRTITPETKWGNDLLRIHTGKTKMTN
jgi:hypothetical protein